MESLFLQILNMSITGSYIILAVMILRLFMKKAPKKYSYLLWSACAFRLCCPISFRNGLSIFNLNFFHMPQSSSAALEHIPQNIAQMPSPHVTTGLPGVNRVINESLPAPSPGVNTLQIAVSAAAAVWIAGIVLLLLYSIISYIILRLSLRNAVISQKNIYQSDKIASPFVFGFIKPKIYIPFGIEENELDYILAHEQYHIKRLDYIIKPAAFFILTLHWFNPLCWTAFMLMSCDMEMSCDEKVLAGGRTAAADYSTALLFFASGKRAPSPSPLAFGETGIRGRIKNILTYKRPKFYIRIISLLLCFAAIIACASNPVIKNKHDAAAEPAQSAAPENDEITHEESDNILPHDIHDLTAAKLSTEKAVYPFSGKYSLKELETMLSNAKQIKGPGCPFDAVLTLTKADGSIYSIEIASDSCAIYKIGDVMYDYSDGDNSRLMTMFGTSADDIVKSLYF